MAIDWASALGGLGVGLAAAGVYRWRLRSDVLKAIATLDADSRGIDLPLRSLLRRSISRSQRIVEQRVRELSAWQNIAQELPFAVLWLGEDDTVLWCNGAAQRLFNLLPEQLGQGLSLVELVRSYDLDCLVQETRQCGYNRRREWTFDPITSLHTRVGGDSFQFAQFQPQPKDLLHKTPIALRGTGIAMDDGQVAVVLENRQSYQDLRESRDRLTNDLAHELRTPLTSIQLVFEALQGQLEPPHSQWVSRAIPEVRRLVTFVQDWLSLSQMEKSNQVSLSLEPLDIRELLITVWQALSPLGDRKGIQCQLNETSPLWLLGDPYRLHRLFQNLIDNAIKFSPPNSAIRINLHLIQTAALNVLPNRPIQPRTDCLALNIDTFDPEEWGGRSDAHSLRLWVIVDIIDGGQGFKPGELPRAFDRLYRGDPSRERSPETSEDEQLIVNVDGEKAPVSAGGGLGLAIARRIAIAHGGSIIAANNPETQGAWLQVRLPYRCKADEDH
ncbi:MAG: sensor histidine kinase [Cyanophyceae cyanobacterium]